MDLAITTLVKATKKGSIAAANSLLDRGFGRPHQSIDLRMLLTRKLTELSADELAALEEQLAAIDDEGADEEGQRSDSAGSEVRA
jgi:hypothetical protein